MHAAIDFIASVDRRAGQGGVTPPLGLASSVVPCRAPAGRRVPVFIDGHADRNGGEDRPPPVPANDTAPGPVRVPAANDNEPVADAP